MGQADQFKNLEMIQIWLEYLKPWNAVQIINFRNINLYL